MPKNWCFWTVVLEKTLESLLDCKEIQPVHPKANQSWVLIGRTYAEALATSREELTHWKRPWCWEGLGAGGEGDDRGWDGWKASVTQWTCVWVNSRSWWWTGRPGVLWFMGSQRVRCHWTELNWWSCPDLLDSLSASPLLFFLKQTLKIRVGDSSINIGSQSQKVEIKVAWGLWPCNLHGYTHIDKCAFPNICT